jgi:hypothetical protein
MADDMLGGMTRMVIEQPLIADLIINTLLGQKDWMSVIHMRSVFRFDISDKFDDWKKINEANKISYKRYFFDFKIVNYITRIHSRTTFHQRIRIHNTMFQHIIHNIELFEHSCFHNHVFGVLMHYIQHEPYYERHALVYMRRLFPDTFYSEDFQDTYDDHEHELFDHEYD